MEIKLTKEQYEEMLEDQYINIIGDGHRIYAEITYDDEFNYIELIKSKNGKTITGYAFDRSEWQRFEPRRVSRTAYRSYEPLCPNCSTSMIYNFEFCPKCGQKLDWSEE